MNWQNKSLLVLALSLFLVAAMGCTTVAPQTVEASLASWDGGKQNSGFLGWTNYDGVTVGIITTNALNRYNALIVIYGNRFLPPLNKGEGTCDTCITGLVLMQAQDIEHFARMNRWRKLDANKP